MIWAVSGARPPRPTATFPSTLLLQTLLGHSHPVSAIAFSRDSSTLISGSHDWKVLIWQQTPRPELGRLGEPKVPYKDTDPLSSFSYDPAHAEAIARYDKWSVFLTLEGHTHPISALAVRKGKDMIVASGDEGGIVWTWHIPHDGGTPSSTVTNIGAGQVSNSMEEVLGEASGDEEHPYVDSLALSNDGKIVIFSLGFRQILGRGLRFPLTNLEFIVGRY